MLLVENSSADLSKINRLRESSALPRIVARWHRHYLVDEKVAEAKIHGCALTDIIRHSETCYFLSRVLSAWLATREGNERFYGAPVNGLAQYLSAIGHYSQSKLWIWQRETEA